MISTVGEYVPDSQVRTILAQQRGKPITERGDAAEAQWLNTFGFEEIGYQRTYETMVFHAPNNCQDAACDCGGMPYPSSFGELAFEGYNSAKEATGGHYRLCFMAARGEIALPTSTES